MVTTYNLDIKESEEDQPMKVSHYDWNRIHDKWLNAVMKEQLAESNGGLRTTQLPQHYNPIPTTANQENLPCTNKSIWHQVQCQTKGPRECRPSCRSLAVIHGTVAKDTVSGQTRSGVPMDGHGPTKQRTSY